ncbi:hypothetical protein LVD15_19510 [Fulvivirga maritima]|uniref:hypothetical protein n=1 Tax=Fulvivirga maritima TaxID=2904247 RepID=UPI001F2892E2|nr:hypothetical protein [Fulvivirga maritima]UII25473.1 hypothetical protein LVD15_19510 [Fulvivirga maritima]
MRNPLLLLLLCGLSLTTYAQKQPEKRLIIEPTFSAGAGWWVYDKSDIQQWDRSHYIANLDFGFNALYCITNTWNVGAGVNYSSLGEHELIAYNDNAVRNKYAISDEHITFRSAFITTEFFLIKSPNYKLGPSVAYGWFDTSATYIGHENDDSKTYLKIGASNQFGLGKNTSLHLQLQYVAMTIKPEEENTKHLIRNLSLLLGLRFHAL